MQSLRTTFLAAGAAIVLAASSASAQTYYYGEDVDGSATTRASNINTAAARSSFLVALGGSALTEEFESFLVGQTPPLSLDFGTGNPIATLLTGFDGNSGRVVNDGGDGLSTNGNGRYANTNPAYYETRSTTDDNSTFRIQFTQNIRSFGFVGIDIGDYNSQLSLAFYRDGVQVDVWSIGPGGLPYTPSDGDNSARDGSRLFAGYTAAGSNVFDEIRFRGTDRDDVFAFDDMTIAVVPEPATVGLLATGVAALGLVGYRRRRQQG